MSDQLWYVVIGGAMALPGLVALYIGLHRDLEERNLKLQVESYAAEIRRLQGLVDQQQRKINDLEVLVANLRSKLSAIGKALKRLTEQLRTQNIEPAVDGDKLLEILEKE